MSINPLNDISKVYLEQVAAVDEGVRPGNVETPLDKAAFKKRRRSLAGKEKSAEARKRGHEGKEWYNSGRTYSPDEAKRSRANIDDEERRTRHRSAVDPDSENDNAFSADKTKNPKKLRKQKAMGESAVPGKPAERLVAVTAIPKSEQDAARERVLAKTKAMREKMKTEALDPVGQEDADIDNDGDTDKTDKYLHNRRKAIGKAISKNRKKDVKEGFSNWRQDLAEVMTDDENDVKIKEKKVNNKIKINPKLGEAVEEIGGTLLEMVEIDEVDYIVESVYDELLDEGYEEDDIEEALEYALIEAKVTFGHDTDKPHQKKTGAGQMVRAVGRLARQKLASKVGGAKKAASAAVARGARKVAKGALGVARKMEGGESKSKTAERKPSTYRGAGAGTKEKVSSGSYTPPTKKKAEKPADPWEGSATTPPKAKTKKATAPKAKASAAAPKRKRKSKLDDLLASVRSEETQVFEGQLKPGESYMDYAKRREAEKKDKRMTVTSADKKGNTPAYKAYKAGDMRYKAAAGLDEKMNLATADMGDVIKDFQQSDAPQFKGKSKEERRKMALAAKLTAERGGRKLGEQMDDSTEISASPTDDKKMEQQKKKIQMQKIRDLTVRLSAARKGVY
jgi:hypothetical protein